MNSISRQMAMVKFYVRRIYHNLKVFAKWAVFSSITGLVVGAFSTLFAECLKLVTQFRTANPWMILLLPLVGIVIVFLYHIFHYKNDKGTNMVLSTIHAETELPFKMAPLIFISTTLTHLFGGSAGREGAALQLGGSIGNQLGRWFRFDEKDRRIVVMCGMSAAFSAIFGTPIAAVVFAMEVVSVGVMYYAALVPCVFASLIASKFARHMGIGPDTFLIKKIPDFLIVPSIKVILLAVCCAAVSVIFCVTLHSLGDFYRDKLKNPYIRIVVSSLVIVALTMVLHTTDYMGAGVPIIERAIAGHVVPLAFVWKSFYSVDVGGGIQGRRDRAIFLRRCGVWLLVWTVDRIIAVALRCAWYGVCILWCNQLPDHVAFDRFRALWISWDSVFYDRDQCQLFAFRVLRVVSRPNDRVFQI